MIKEGIYLDMSEEDYRKLPAINYSNLADFNNSPDHALMEKGAKSYFEEGNAFEMLIEDTVKGTTKFEKRFFIADAPGGMPEDLAGWIEKGENLNEKYRLKNDGTRNNHSKRLHAWLDECQKAPGRMPMGKDQIQMLNLMVDNFLKMQPLIDMDIETDMGEILSISDFQVPVVWYAGKQRKKSLIDCVFQTNTAIYAFDIKTTADTKRFPWMVKDRYWIQEIHYSAGLGRIFPGKDIVWRFVTASKAKPYISQPFCIDKTSTDMAWERYNELCKDYQNWIDDKRPARGWKELESVKIWF